MTAKVLLVEDDPIRAQRIAQALEACDVQSFHTTGADEAEEALGVRQFDIILLSSLTQPPETVRQLQSSTRHLCPSAKFFVWGTCEDGLCDAIIPGHVSEADLGRELALAREREVADGGDSTSRLPLFDFDTFEQQMGGDADLMREIIGIFFEESAGQMRELSDAIAGGDMGRTSRLAHSLKGSLGSLHAARARHWAQTLESAAASGDTVRTQAALNFLSQAMAELTPRLAQVLS
jgi:HPt (histidine-containing phosphotransfer) domain-containing protein